MRLSLSILALLIAASGFAASFRISGTVCDAANSEPLAYASVRIDGSKSEVRTDADGHYSITSSSANITLICNYIGFQQLSLTLTLRGDSTVNLRLEPDARQLKEVVVTARENTSLSSGSRIDRDAMAHLQPTSFSDLLELLPGGVSKTPDMSRTNSIALRETGNIGASGAVSDNPDYAISSLGTPFIVDGAPIGTDANMSAVPGASSGDAAYLRSTVNRGVDMRSISTDNIESVEIVRGIPSAEYGNLTSGMVNIKRTRRATPWTARFKADEYSKLFAVGKGFALDAGGNRVINADATYLDSKADPRNNLENYRRITGSLRSRLRWQRERVVTAWNLSADYTGSFDNAKSDPDLTQRKIDEYRSSYNRYALSSELTLTFPAARWIESAGLTASASLVSDVVERRKQVTANGTPLAPTSMGEGVHDGKYLMGTYLAEFKSDGRPLDLFIKARAAGNATLGLSIHDYKAGAEWTLSKNYGRGQIYDLERPLSGGWTTRPRSYRSIPALNVLSAVIEDNVTLPLGSHTLEAQAGVRMIMLPTLSDRYYLSGRPYFDPRLNVVWRMPAFDVAGLPMQLSIGGGFGLTTKMPTIDYLFPQVHYADFVQLGYFDVNNPQEFSKVNLRTYITDPTNYDLRAARNRKWEVRMGADWGKNRLSLTYFRESLRSGFRYSAVYDRYTFRRYDASAIDPSTLTGPPSVDNLPYTDADILDGYNRVTNGTRIDKEGVELQLTTARWQPLRTALTLSGAWFRSRYSNSQMLYYPVATVVGQTPVSDRYVGIYDTDDGRVNHQLSTTLMFDTQIPRWGLIFTTTLQTIWYTKSRRLRENGTPVGYISASDGEFHPWTEADASDTMLQHLVRRFSDQVFATQSTPIALYLNLKATKQIGRWLRLSAFVNRIVDYLPDYQSNGVTIRRHSEAYFGMEATFTF